MRYEERFSKACTRLRRDWERMVSFYAFPRAHWKHLRTSNVVESPFASVRLRTAASKRYKRIANAEAILWRLLQVAEKRFRKLDAPHLLALVAAGEVFVNGDRNHKSRKPAHAA